MVKPDFSFLRQPHALVLSVILLCLAGLAPVLTPPEKAAESRPLHDIPTAIGSWTILQEGVVDAETEALLKADDTLSRSYVKPPTARLPISSWLFLRHSVPARATLPQGLPARVRVDAHGIFHHVGSHPGEERAHPGKPVCGCPGRREKPGALLVSDS